MRWAAGGGLVLLAYLVGYRDGWEGRARQVPREIAKAVHAALWQQRLEQRRVRIVRPLLFDDDTPRRGA